MSALLGEGLLPRLQHLTALAMEQHEPLRDLREVAAMDIKEGTLRLRVHRGRHIAIKRGKKLYSYPRLALESGSQDAAEAAAEAGGTANR